MKQNRPFKTMDIIEQIMTIKHPKARIKDVGFKSLFKHISCSQIRQTAPRSGDKYVYAGLTLTHSFHTF